MITHAIIDHDASQMTFYASADSMFQQANFINCGLSTICNVKNEWSYLQVAKAAFVQPLHDVSYIVERDGEVLTGPASGYDLLTPDWGMPIERPFNLWQILRFFEPEVFFEIRNKSEKRLLDRVAGCC